MSDELLGRSVMEGVEEREQADLRHQQLTCKPSSGVHMQRQPLQGSETPKASAPTLHFVRHCSHPLLWSLRSSHRASRPEARTAF